MTTNKIAKYLKDEMKSQKLTNQQLADKSGLAESTIRQLKNKPGHNVKLATCDCLAKGLGKSLRTFLEEAGIIDLLGLTSLSSKDADRIVNVFVNLADKYNLNITNLDRNERLELANYLVNSIRLLYKK